MQTNLHCVPIAAILFAFLQSPASAREMVVWKMGEPDRSDHELTASAPAATNQPLVVRIGSGNELRQWPKIHPGSGNVAFGGAALSLYSGLRSARAEPARGVLWARLICKTIWI
jgi:hypothetical protein